VTKTESITGHIARLQPGRSGICDWAQREVDRLCTRMAEAEALPAGQRHDMMVRVVEHQLIALECELARLSAPSFTARVTP
jgi:hypothetical protein